MARPWLPEKGRTVVGAVLSPLFYLFVYYTGFSFLEQLREERAVFCGALFRAYSLFLYFSLPLFCRLPLFYLAA